MKTIGQFAKDNNVTVKTMHHYEKLDLITPSKVDAETGYRYYDEQKAIDVKVVLFLKELGLSLSEIKDVLNQNYTTESLKDIMIYKKKQSVMDKESASSRLHKLNSILAILDKDENREINYKEIISMGEIEMFTDKYGRGQFVEESEKLFDKAKKEKTPLCVIQMDLDMFKKLNDTFGYDIGDIVLERTQTELTSALKEAKYESILERRGGDEFAITIKATTLQASKLATTLLNKVVEIDYSDVADNLRVSITAGIAGLTKRTESYAELVHDATAQLFKLKKNKR